MAVYRTPLHALARYHAGTMTRYDTRLCVHPGVHAGNYLPFQEFFLIPTGAATFREAMQMGSETYHSLKALIKKT